MFKLLIPLLAKNSCYENANQKAAYCIKNLLISSSSATNVVENLALRRHFLFSTTNRKTIHAFPTKPQHHQLEVSHRCLGQKLELLTTNKGISLIRNFNSSSNNVLFVESTEAVNTLTSTEKSDSANKVKEASKGDSFNRTQTSLYSEEDEENTFDIM